VVLDLFAGSGSTLISAESVGRRCFCVEIDARYCDVIVRRFIAFVGKDNVPEEIRQRYVKEASNV
jgi:DNA modification methylase